MFVHAALNLIRSCEICIKWEVLLKHCCFLLFSFFKWFACQLFPSKAAWGRRLGCCITQASCPPPLPRESGMLGSRTPSGSPLGAPAACPGAARRWCHGALCAAFAGTRLFQIHPDPPPTPTCLRYSRWSCTSTGTSGLTGRPDPDYNALWTLQARLKYLEGSVWLMGCIFDILVVEKS